MKYQVINILNPNQIEFEGTKEECIKWDLEFGTELTQMRKYQKSLYTRVSIPMSNSLSKELEEKFFKKHIAV